MFTDKFETEFACLKDVHLFVRFHPMQDVTGRIRVVIGKMVYQKVLGAMESIESTNILTFIIRASYEKTKYSPQILDQVLVGLHA